MNEGMKTAEAAAEAAALFIRRDGVHSVTRRLSLPRGEYIHAGARAAPVVHAVAAVRRGDRERLGNPGGRHPARVGAEVAACQSRLVLPITFMYSLDFTNPVHVFARLHQSRSCIRPTLPITFMYPLDLRGAKVRYTRGSIYTVRHRW